QIIRALGKNNRIAACQRIRFHDRRAQRADLIISACFTFAVAGLAVHDIGSTIDGKDRTRSGAHSECAKTRRKQEQAQHEQKGAYPFRHSASLAESAWGMNYTPTIARSFRVFDGVVEWHRIFLNDSNNVS